RVPLPGAEDTRPTEALADEQRILLSEKDVMQNYQQVQRLENMGYRGIYAFEPFSSQLASGSEAEIEEHMN
ncbi:inosose isomerase, partial [Salmonella enterica]